MALPKEQAERRAQTVIDDINKRYRKRLPLLTTSDMTCTDCPCNAECEWAFDDYNTEGDCLALK